MIHNVVVEQCNECIHIENGYCLIYIYPDRQFSRIGGCAAKPHIEKVIEKKGFVDPLKASKQQARGLK